MLSLEEQESSQCLVVGAYAMQAALSTIPYFSKPQANRGSAITISPFLGSSEEVQKIGRRSCLQYCRNSSPSPEGSLFSGKVAEQRLEDSASSKLHPNGDYMKKGSRHFF